MEKSMGRSSLHCSAKFYLLVVICLVVSRLAAGTHQYGREHSRCCTGKPACPSLGTLQSPPSHVESPRRGADTQTSPGEVVARLGGGVMRLRGGGWMSRTWRGGTPVGSGETASLQLGRRPVSLGADADGEGDGGGEERNMQAGGNSRYTSKLRQCTHHG